MSRAAINTVWPAPASAVAVSLPTPLLPPVTMIRTGLSHQQPALCVAIKRRSANDFRGARAVAHHGRARGAELSRPAGHPATPARANNACPQPGHGLRRLHANTRDVAVEQLGGVDNRLTVQRCAVLAAPFGRPDDDVAGLVADQRHAARGAAACPPSRPPSGSVADLD